MCIYPGKPKVEDVVSFGHDRWKYGLFPTQTPPWTFHGTQYMHRACQKIMCFHRRELKSLYLSACFAKHAHAFNHVQKLWIIFKMLNISCLFGESFQSLAFYLLNFGQKCPPLIPMGKIVVFHGTPGVDLAYGCVLHLKVPCFIHRDRSVRLIVQPTF